MRSGTLPMAVLRAEYEAVRFPLQLVEDVGMAHLDQRTPLRLAYEKMLVTVDRAAAHLLDDEAAATRACALRQRTAAVRVTVALRKRRTQQRLEAEGAARMERWRRHQARLRRGRG
ncbi:hypothetical protein [Rhodococcus sp. WAY2]|uniref:hypothetical protein n=1 Tax=Rhodococcus sp. WAY2 TaxID=2663121 RepID=UPI001F44A697|nr:hypothetical protein [Rhodococcus sp. WAY2]